MKKSLQILIALIMLAASYTATACSITPVIYTGGPTTFCQGGFTILNTDTYVSYLWSTGDTTQFINVSSSGNYSVYVTDVNGCTGTSTITVLSVLPYSFPTITASGPTTFCIGGSITLTSSPAASYLWNTGATTQSIVDSGSGDFYVTITDTNG